MEAPVNDLPPALSSLVALLDLLPQPTFVIAPSGLLLGCNAAMQQLAGQTMGAPLIDPLQLLSAASIARLTAAFEERPAPVTIDLDRADGSRQIARLLPLPASLPPWYAMVVVFEPLSAPAQASRTRTTRGEALLRHDLAGPVTAILGTAELLLVREPDLPRQLRDGIGQILDNCARINELLAGWHEREGAARAAEPSGGG